MRPSRRISTLNPDGTDGWEILRSVAALRARGIAVTNLTIGDHDRTTPGLILDAMDASARGGNTGYSLFAGSEALRATIAARVEARTGVPTRPANIVVTPGGQAGLFSAFMATLEPGGTGLYLDPHYATYPGTIRSVSGIPAVVPTRPEAGFRPTRADLDAAPPAGALLINTPNNPTGVVYDRATLEAIAGFVTGRDMWLISDEVYDTQVWEGDHLSPRALPGLAERTLVIGSLSKSHVMTGFRLGWVVGPEEVIGRIIELMTCMTYGVPGFIQDAALVALRDGAAVEAEVADTYRRRRAAALAALDGANHVRPVAGGGAMYLMLDIRATGMSGNAFADALLDRHRIAVMPGESFGATAAGHLRVALTRPEADLTRALRTLVDFAGDVR